MSGEGVKRGGRHAIIDAEEEQKMLALGMPVRCCDYWPECSHVLAWVEELADADDPASRARARDPPS